VVESIDEPEGKLGPSVYFSMGKNYGIPIDINKNSGDLKPILQEEKEKPTDLKK